MIKDKVIVVTGAGRGIGRAIALAAAAAGAKVVVNDLGSQSDGRDASSKVADEVVAEIAALGGQAASNYDSVATAHGATNIVATALDVFGRIDIVVNNAGIARDRMIFNMSEEDFDAVIDTHLKGTFLVTKAVAGHFKAQNSGRIINFTSTSGLIGSVGQANYAAAKMGIVGLTRICALDLKRHNVTANSIAPFAWTRLVATIPNDPSQAQRIERAKTLEPQHIPPLVVYLASDAANKVTGQIFGVRGKEIMVFSQPRPIQTIGRAEGWTAEAIADVMAGTLGNSLCPLEVSGDVFRSQPFV